MDPELRSRIGLFKGSVVVAALLLAGYAVVRGQAPDADQVYLPAVLCTAGCATTAEAEDSVSASAENAAEDNSARLIKQGRHIFRFDTFGDEAFWGDTLQLHKAIEGSRFGGVG